MNILVLFGGKSTEYSVSCVSAASVLKHISDHDVTKIGITSDGRWYKTDAALDEISDGSWVSSETNVPVTVDISAGRFSFGTDSYKPDVVFPVLHGKNGEDGTVQGMLELMRLKYVGCRVLGSSVCMDKAYTKLVFAQAGIKQVDWVTVNRNEYNENAEAVISEVRQNLTYPVFVKPSNAGSSIGIMRADDETNLRPAIDNAFCYDRRIVIESGVNEPMEIETAVLGNDEPVASVTGRIIPANDFYDFEAKYNDNRSRLIIPSGIDNEDLIRNTAIAAYKACDCKGLARVDFLIDKDGTVYLNEINTIPGFTSISMYPKLFEASGIPYGELIGKLIDLAVSFED